MKLKAYAKINLTLDIIARRGDGFHELRSVLMPISLFDVVSVEKSDKIAFTCDLPELRGNDNFCVRAAEAFFRFSGVSGGASISLQKHIPYPAGLGGGSADAAAVLNALNEVYERPLTREQLFEAGASVGSDVPFCMLGSAALCEGRGEKLTPLAGIPKMYVTVCIGSGRLSTASVFKAYDDSGCKPTDNTSRFLEALSSGDANAMCRSMGNGFTDVCASLCPETKEMRARMRSCGAQASLLSGSGPSVYGVFFSRDRALAAAREMRDHGFFAVDCETVEF